MERLIKINASSAYIVKNCVGSLDFESKKYPLEKQSKDAKAGTDAHTVLTDQLKKKEIPVSLVSYFPLDIDKMFIEDGLFLAPNEEKKLGFSLYAQPDISVVSKQTLFILDLKTGFSDVSEMDALQNIVAAYLWLRSNPKTKITKVICRFIGTETGLTTYDVFTPEEIYKTIDEFLAGVRKGMAAKKAQLKTGPHCRYCSHRTHCPQLKKVLIEFTNPKLRGVDVEELPRDLVRLLPVADKIIDDLRKKLKERLEDGLMEIEGVSLKFQNSPRAWDLSVDAETLASRTGKPVEAFQDQKLKTVKAVLDEFPEVENQISRLITQGKQARLVIGE